jgi:RHS repeat-associated protein
VTFKYDPFGRRIEKIAPSGTTIYAYDGDNIVEQLNTSGGATARFTQGLGIDEPLEVKIGSGSYYYSADGLGSVVALTKSNGSATNTYFGYNTFGWVNATDTVANPFRFTGREWDPETNLYYYRARYYDPLWGRFISEDPVNFSIGPDFYTYVANDPAGQVDPTGLCPCKYHKVMLYYTASFRGSGYPDYHWYRQDSNGKWSSKHGLLPVGPQVDSPDQDARSTGYDVLCGTMCAKNLHGKHQPNYNPSIWNDPDHVHTNNCYSYACDRLHPKGPPNRPQPGESSGYRLPADFTCLDVINAAKKDGLKEDK